jgi:thiol-disulfide isomerase/thioredoxin
MTINLPEIRKKAVTPTHYIESLDASFREKFLIRKATYEPRIQALEQLRRFGHEYVIIAFSATWCKDCAANIPVLALISERTGIEVRVFGGLKKDPLSLACKWRIPPSPPEVVDLNVDKIPLMIIADRRGEEIGRIIENPKLTPTLEEEIYEIIKSKR